MLSLVHCRYLDKHELHDFLKDAAIRTQTRTQALPRSFIPPSHKSDPRLAGEVTQDIAGLPFLSRKTTCFFCAIAPQAAVPRTKTSSGMIMTMRYSATLLSLHNVPQYGAVVIVREDH
jgi:hypothetical protein